ncbi:MAG: hypothetical protein OEW19_00530 [Acidobacteriota bacterium]|nr:hypothetical protein [Acidobacteriota bacterium]
MTLRYLPLLAVQRDLYALPRGMERFRAYIEAMRDDGSSDLALPLVAMNPMGKDHVPALIEQYLAMDADAIGAQATLEAAARLTDAPGEVEATLVVSDDLKGGWTNRYASEFGHRFENQAMFRRGWAVGILWTADAPSPDAAREAVLTAVYRAAHHARHGAPRTLAGMLAQEGWVMAMAGCTTPRLGAEDLAYTRTVIAPHLPATDRATQMACIFGDPCARALGYEPLGLSERAGLALALHDADEDAGTRTGR